MAVTIPIEVCVKAFNDCYPRHGLNVKILFTTCPTKLGQEAHPSNVHGYTVEEEEGGCTIYLFDCCGITRSVEMIVQILLERLTGGDLRAMDTGKDLLHAKFVDLLSEDYDRSQIEALNAVRETKTNIHFDA